MKCCLLECAELGRVDCQQEAEWEIWDGQEPAHDHCTQACTAHVGYLLCDTPEMHRVYPVVKEENMKTTLRTCPKCGKEIASLVKSYIAFQEVTARDIRGDEYVLRDDLDLGMLEIYPDTVIYGCPLCGESVCSSDEHALSFLRGD